MNSDLNLSWSDIVSPTMTPDDYLRDFGPKIKSNYEVYEPKAEILDKICGLLKDKKEQLKIAAFGADWCPDCHKNVPRMIKLVKRLKTKDVELRILYGIMVNALHNQGESTWHKTRSPPEAVNPKFELKAIPTFYFFDKKGQYFGRIVEHPRDTIEEDTLNIMKKHF